MNMKKNILITFLFKEGAGPVFTLEMARGFAQNGCDVYVIISSKIANKDDWKKETALKEVYFLETGTRDTAIQTTMSFFFKERRKLKKHFNHIIFDRIISTFYHPWAISLMRCLKGPKYTICHDPIHHSGVPFIERYMTTKYIKSSDDVVVLTKSFIPIVQKRFGFDLSKIHYMPHGRMKSYKKDTFLTVDFSLNTTINFLFFGRISEYKGLTILAKAYSTLVKTKPNVSLRVVGSGNFEPFKEFFEGLPNVDITNKYIEDKDVESYFCKPNTILVLPYLDASQSGVIPVALEFGVPIIASETGGLREQMNNGAFGLYCKPNDINALYQIMDYCVDHPNDLNMERKKMAEYLQSIDWDKVTAKLITG